MANPDNPKFHQERILDEQGFPIRGGAVDEQGLFIPYKEPPPIIDELTGKIIQFGVPPQEVDANGEPVVFKLPQSPIIKMTEKEWINQFS